MALIDEDEELSVFDQLLAMISKMTDEEQAKLLEVLKKRRPAEREQRINLYTETIFTVGGEKYSGVVLDMSSSGLFIETKDSFSTGQEIVINMKRSRDSKIIKVRGRIVRVKSNGVGIQFFR